MYISPHHQENINMFIITVKNYKKQLFVLNGITNKTVKLPRLKIYLKIKLS